MKLMVWISFLFLAACAKFQTQTAADATDVPALTHAIPHEDIYFNNYVLKAVDAIHRKYALLGYSINDALTHDMAYGNRGWVKRLDPSSQETMCVAAQLEILLTAFEIYESETGDHSVWNFLPKTSWERLGASDIRGHIWVNHDFNSYGTADALKNFGMGEQTPFAELTPGSFINFNRTNGTGHAATFIDFIDKDGKEYDSYNSQVIGFKYYSAQGKSGVGAGGFDYRYAVFSQFGCPELPYKRDCGVIDSTKSTLLNTGRMLLPTRWTPQAQISLPGAKSQKPSQFDPNYFSGLTTDD